MSKWGDRPHWEFDGVLLGEDEHGTWLGFARGTRHRRPGMAYDSDVDTVTLVPRDGWYLATFHAPGIWCQLYVDIATPATWDGTTLRSVDLDLDVIRMADLVPAGIHPRLVHPAGAVWIDDEDEFAEHRVAFGYPDDVVRAAEASRYAVLAAATAETPPFDGSHRRWLASVSPA